MKINKIYNEDCLDTMKKIPDNFIDCIITSPPYNKGYWSKNRNLNNGFKTKSRRIDYGIYNDIKNPEDYIKNQTNVIKECLRILKDKGSFFYNHVDILHEHNTIHPSYIYNFPIKQIIIWNRKNTPKLDVSYFYPINEYVFWIKKNKSSKPYFYRDQCIYKTNIWNINPEKENIHPAPFPKTLTGNCILGTTKENDLIYDQYMGSGTTAIAAKELKRNYIGSEINIDYIHQHNKHYNQKQLF